MTRAANVRRLLLGVASLLLACGDDAPLRPPAAAPYLTIFLVDGLQQGVFEAELAAGNIPELARLVAEGTRVRHGVTSFPSVSAYAYYPFLTGVPSARSGITGLRWFDRSRQAGNYRNYIGSTSGLLDLDLRGDVQTIFELFPQAHTTSTNTFIHRGADGRPVEAWTYASSTYARHLALGRMIQAIPGGRSLVPDYREGAISAMQVAIDDLANRPKVQWVTLPHLDAIYHFQGRCAEYLDELHLIDRLIGDYRVASAGLGMEGERLYAVVSDHGGVEVDRHFDIALHLESLGIPMDRDVAVHWVGGELDDPLSRYDDRDAIVAVNGNMMSHVYLRKPGVAGAAGFRVRPSRQELSRYPSRAGPRDLVSLLRAQAGVALLVVREADHRIGLYSAHGSAEIGVLGPEYSYRVIEGEDPLGYREDPAVAALVGNGLHPSPQWLAATHGSHYPDTVPQLGSFLDQEGPGDLVLIAAPGYDLADDFEPVVGNFHGGHGGVDAAQFRVPFVLAGPGVRAGAVLDFARAEDIGATLIDLVGGRPLRRPDGEVLPVRDH